MGTDEKQKICIECRALVPNDSAICPECGYPFDDSLTTRCRSCNSVIVPDVENCPVCGQVQAVPQPEKASDPVDTPSSDLPENQVVDTVEGNRDDSEQPAAPRVEVVAPAPEKQGVATEEIQQLIDVQTRTIENMLKQVLESNSQLIASLSEQQKENQNALQQSVDAIKAMVESSAPKESKDAELLEMLADLKVAIADVASQNTASANMIVGVVNSSAAKTPEPPVFEMPNSLKWLDYMFIAIIVALIFSMGNLLIMAYVARLIMSSME